MTRIICTLIALAIASVAHANDLTTDKSTKMVSHPMNDFTIFLPAN